MTVQNIDLNTYTDLCGTCIKTEASSQIKQFGQNTSSHDDIIINDW